MSSKKPLSIQDMIQKMNESKEQKKIEEKLEISETQKRYEAQQNYINEQRRRYGRSSGGRRPISTFLGASTYSDFWDSASGGVIQPLVSDVGSEPYTTNTLTTERLYDLSGIEFTETFSTNYHSVFAYNPTDGCNYFIGFNGTDTIFGKMDQSGNITNISALDLGDDIRFTQLIYVGDITSVTDFIFIFANEIYEMNVDGIYEGPDENFKNPILPAGTMLSSMTIVNGEYYLFFAEIDYDDIPSLGICKYNPTNGVISDIESVTMNSIPSEITTSLKVVDVVAVTSDYGFPSTTGNKIYANIVLSEIGYINLDGEFYYFIVEMDVNGDSEYITNGDYVYDLSYYKR